MKEDIETAKLKTESGLSATIHSLGATLAELWVPTPNGPVNVVLNYPDAEAYRGDRYYVGSTVGRFANRIENAKIRIDGVDYQLDANEEASGHCLHGGVDGLHKRVWKLAASDNDRKLTCSHRSLDGSAGFPGNVDIQVIYQLLNDHMLAIDFFATSDKETVLSLATHSYFECQGPGKSIDDLELKLFADSYTPVNSSLIPTGEILPVAGTRFDFRESRALGGEACDINFVVDGAEHTLRPAAEVCSRETGIKFRVHTTQAGLQFYTGDYLDAPFRPRQGFCLEAQSFPNAPNVAAFPSARLSPGARYQQRTVYEFFF